MIVLEKNPMTQLFRFILVVSLTFCSCENETQNSTTVSYTEIGEDTTPGCPDSEYPDWRTSDYVLPYPVGTEYFIGLSHCTRSFHAEGEPDEFAIDFNMNVGTTVTAAREGTVVFVEESGNDGSFPNNLVVVRHDDGSFAQYMHLTSNGADVEVDDVVQKGDPIGRSGATGLAGYPHLHFVVTRGGWQYPYQSIPYNFKNTEENPKSLRSGKLYRALSY